MLCVDYVKCYKCDCQTAKSAEAQFMQRVVQACQLFSMKFGVEFCGFS
jgi:hypothetical protein